MLRQLERFGNPPLTIQGTVISRQPLAEDTQQQQQPIDATNSPSSTSSKLPHTIIVANNSYAAAQPSPNKEKSVSLISDEPEKTELHRKKPHRTHFSSDKTSTTTADHHRMIAKPSTNSSDGRQNPLDSATTIITTRTEKPSTSRKKIFFADRLATTFSATKGIRYPGRKSKVQFPFEETSLRVSDTGRGPSNGALPNGGAPVRKTKWEVVRKNIPKIIDQGIEEGILPPRKPKWNLGGDDTGESVNEDEEDSSKKTDDEVQIDINDISMIHEAIPFLPVPAALLCLFLNIVLPGIVKYREALMQRRQEAVATAAIEALTKDSVLHRKDVKNLVGQGKEVKRQRKKSVMGEEDNTPS